MDEDSVRAYCPVCRHRQTFGREHVHHTLHLVLSILTFGLWLVSWVAICIGNMLWPWACTQCGWRLARAEAWCKTKAKTQPVNAPSDEE